MREILFRGKDAESGKWLYGWVFGEKAKSIIEIDTKYVSEHGVEAYYTSVVIPETVGQYTGLDDKNGVKIFEGDIISYFYDDWIEPEVGVVKYMSDDGYPAFELEHSPVFDDEHHVIECNMLALLDQSGDDSYFVAGNLHDNPELVED